MDESERLERVRDYARRSLEDAIALAELTLAAGDDPEAMISTYEAAARASKDLQAAGQALDDALIAEALAITPAPYERGTPDEEQAWLSRLEEEDRESWDRLVAARAAYGALPSMDDDLVDESAPVAERVRQRLAYGLQYLRESTAVMDELDVAEKQAAAVDAALDRALAANPEVDDEDAETPPHG